MKIFLRFSTLERLERFQMEGYLYCNSIQLFAQHPEENGIGDKYENIFNMHYFKNGILTVKPIGVEDQKEINLSFTDAMLHQFATQHWINIFCLYTVDFTKDYEVGQIYPISEQMRSGFDYLIAIFDTNEFAKRVEKALLTLKKEFKFDYIKYVDFSKHTGDKDVFTKPHYLSYQNEYRIAIKTESDKPYELSIGSIEDISKIYEVNNFELKLDYK